MIEMQKKDDRNIILVIFILPGRRNFLIGKTQSSMSWKKLKIIVLSWKMGLETEFRADLQRFDFEVKFLLRRRRPNNQIWEIVT